MRTAQRLMMTAQGAGIPQAANLKIWIPCDGGTTDLARAASFTINGSPTLATGVQGNATLFDANTEYIDLGNIQSVLNTGTGSFTVAGWFKRVSLTAAGHQAIFERDMVGSRELNLYCDGNENNSNHCILFLFTGGGTGFYIIENTPVSTNDLNWHHLLVVKNGSTPTMYIDGTARAATVVNSWAASKASFAQPTHIGRTQANGNTANMHVQHVMFWNTALTAAEVLALYNLTLAGGLAL